jgi:hypothetical protein
MRLRSRGAMSSILPFIRKRSDFDDTLTKLMGEAFEAACRQLHEKGMPPVIQEILAKRIIEAAQRGERDPQRLRDAALSAIRPNDRPGG